MIYISGKLRRLVEDTQKQRGSSFTLPDLSAEVGIPVDAIERMLNNQCSAVMLTTIDRLCTYFHLNHIGELVDYVPDNQGRRRDLE